MIKISDEALIDIYNNKLSKKEITAKYKIPRWQARIILSAIYGRRLTGCDYEVKSRVNSKLMLSCVQAELRGI